MESFKVFLIGGYCKTGAGAIHSFLKEFNKHHYLKCEFTLLGRPDGLIDLEDALVHSWAPWRSDLAVKRFEKIIHILGRERKSGFFHLSLPGKNYNKKISKNFTALSENFISDLVSIKYRGRWSGLNWEMSLPKWILRRFKKNVLGIKTDFEIKISSPGENFLPMARKYLRDLLSDSIKERNKKTNAVVLDLATYHCRPDRLLQYFDHPKMILIDRDPRDNFLDIKRKRANNINVSAEDFISWYRLMRSQSDCCSDLKDKVLRLNFEDLALNYNETSKKLYDFLEIKPEDHTERNKFLNLERAKKNVGLWKNHKSRSMEKIYSELKEYCRW